MIQTSIESFKPNGCPTADDRTKNRPKITQYFWATGRDAVDKAVPY